MYKRFEELNVWKEARKYKKDIHELVKKFPRKELYVLTNQLCRAANSITANIAEGYGRYHWQENIQACRVSRGSINEILDHLYTALDCEYITQETFDNYYSRGRDLERLLNGYIRYLEKCKNT
ncbi:MAG: four helix bundle protein [Elusimicrobia bacterium]|nr:four helix bundle protein [Elusimicrobiota bacterium]